MQIYFLGVRKWQPVVRNRMFRIGHIRGYIPFQKAQIHSLCDKSAACVRRIANCLSESRIVADVIVSRIYRIQGFAGELQ